MEAKVYEMNLDTGKMDLLVPRQELPLYSRVFNHDMEWFAVISKPDKYGNQEIVAISEFRPRFLRIDKLSKGISQKRGIGKYFDDIEPDFRFDQEEVEKYINLAVIADSVQKEKEKQKQEADRKEIAELPNLYPYLKQITKENNGYNAQKANVVAELKHCFPNQKFSVKKDGYDTIRIDWVDGPTYDDVRGLLCKFIDYETDITGDFRDPAPTNFTTVFGGFKYIFETREMSPEIEALAAFIEANHNLPKYEPMNNLRKIWSSVTIPIGASNFRLERNENESCYIENLYVLKFDSEPVPEKSEETINLNVISEPDLVSIKLVDYSEKSFAIIGDTKPIKDILKNLGGSFNARLTCGMGWIFPLTKKEAVLSELGL